MTVRLSRTERYIIRAILITIFITYSLVIFAVGYKYGASVERWECDQYKFEQSLDSREGEQE